jgi:hypothetical protein
MFDMIVNIPVEAWDVLCEMAPYLLFGFLVAGILSVVIPPEKVERHLGGRGFMPVFKASLFGVPLPLCSCGVIPVATSLRRHGASRGATTAFLLSTPQTGVDSIFVTYALLGPVFAVFRPIAALVTGVIGGGLVSLFDKNGKDAGAQPQACTDACCTGEGGNKVWQAFRYAFVTLPRDIGKALIVGLVLVGLISVLIPDDFFADSLGTGLSAMLVMMLLGMPMYVCATASVPIAAALIAKGVSPGAALVFLIAGPATNAATITTLWKVMGRRTTIIYMATVAVGALAAGLTLDGIFTIPHMHMTSHEHWMMPGIVNQVSAVVLLAILAAALWWPERHVHTPKPVQPAPHNVTLAVTGMTCNHCAQSVQQALNAVPGVQSTGVDLKTGRAYVQGEAFDIPPLLAAVTAKGFGAAEVTDTAAQRI